MYFPSFPEDCPSLRDKWQGTDEEIDWLHFNEPLTCLPNQIIGGEEGEAAFPSCPKHPKLSPKSPQKRSGLPCLFHFIFYAHGRARESNLPPKRLAAVVPLLFCFWLLCFSHYRYCPNCTLSSLIFSSDSLSPLFSSTHSPTCLTIPPLASFLLHLPFPLSLLHLLPPPTSSSSSTSTSTSPPLSFSFFSPSVSHSLRRFFNLPLRSGAIRRAIGLACVAR
ncbi:hypothetical protein B9Z19DRAFT_797424 [Tuber borchii]|uniref:Uncharacterized protein n=1 Tax=Tuber borchii TaxID=42251 RepID=A0A2T6ZWB2_TUBBO|nr:hypothetical protein B9Z19DRAFT_797424 [Tuber borchii]